MLKEYAESSLKKKSKDDLARVQSLEKDAWMFTADGTHNK